MLRYVGGILRSLKLENSVTLRLLFGGSVTDSGPSGSRPEVIRSIVSGGTTGRQWDRHQYGFMTEF